MTLPAPDTHCWDDDTGQDVWSYSRELVEQMLAERDAVLKMALSALERVTIDPYDADAQTDAYRVVKAIREVLEP